MRTQEEEDAARRRAADKAAFDALPYPLRLTAMRCTVCHGAETYANERHNRIGWELVILRMQHLNAAPLAAGERSVIAAHLAETYPATGGAAWNEALQQLAATLAPMCVWLALKAARARRGTRRPDKLFASKPGARS